MHYTKGLTIPSETSEDSPIRTTLVLTEGVIRKLWVRWRWGSANLCGVRILYHEFQYWPLTLLEWYPSSVHPLEFTEEFPIGSEPYELTIEAYNDDDTFPHNVWVAVELRRERIAPELREFFEYFGRR